MRPEVSAPDSEEALNLRIEELPRDPIPSATPLGVSGSSDLPGLLIPDTVSLDPGENALPELVEEPIELIEDGPPGVPTIVSDASPVVAAARRWSTRSGSAESSRASDIPGFELEPSQSTGDLPVLAVQTQAPSSSRSPVLEVPVEVSPAPSPFDSLRDVNLRAGLERTGIIPMVEFEREEFVPPSPPGKSGSDRHLAGTDDIPLSAEAVKARLERAEARVSEAPAAPQAPAQNGLQLGGTAKNRASVPPPPPPVPRRPEGFDLEPTLRPPPQAPARESRPASLPGQNGSADPTVEMHAGRRAAMVPAPPPPRKILSEEEPPTNPRISISDRVDAALEPIEDSAAETLSDDDQPLPRGNSIEHRRDPSQALSSDLGPPRGQPASEPEPPRSKPHSEPPSRSQPGLATAKPVDTSSSNGARPVPEATRALVDALMHGRSLTSADRAQLVLAIGRLLVKKGLLTPEELALALSE
jgi:hypothetical protein